MSMINPANAVLTFAGLLALAIGVRAMLAPEALGAAIGYGLPGPDALNEVRAQYGGFFLAIALVCGLALFGVAPKSAALTLLIATFGGIFFGRIVAAGIDGGIGAYGPTIKALFVVDLVGAAAATWALATLPR